MAKKTLDVPQAEVLQTPTPDNTPIPGGGSWRWGFLPPGKYGLLPTPGWVANTPDQPLQTGDTGALQTFESTQE